MPSADTATPIDAARDLLADDLDRYHDVLHDVLEEQSAYLTSVEKELYRKGKKLRPILLLCCARLAGVFDPARDWIHAQGYDVDADDFDVQAFADDLAPIADAVAAKTLPKRAIHGAVSLEMLHVATLIHDDIIDRAPTRRGLPSINASRGPDQALLLGNMQFVQAVRLFADTVEVKEDMDLVRKVLDTGYQICAGELDELETPPQDLTTEQMAARYFRTIDRKTAILFGLACESGVQLVRGSTRLTYALGRYGRKIGQAFQVMDDLFDVLRSEDRAGKAPGTDLRERRFSLPVIYALDRCDAEHPLTRMMYTEHGSPSEDEAEFEAALAAVTHDAVIERTYNEARRLVLDAVAYLDHVPPCPYRATLHDLAFYVVDRGFL
jgi:heptaprenyl diphosphate synthase